MALESIRDAVFAEDPILFLKNMVFAEFALENWPTEEKSQAFAKQAGNDKVAMEGGITLW